MTKQIGLESQEKDMPILEFPEANHLFVFHRLTMSCIAGLFMLHVNVLYGQNEPAPETPSQTGAVSSDAEQGEWIQLFNGRDINNWTVKLNHHEIDDSRLTSVKLN